MNPALGKEVNAAIRKSRTTSAALAARIRASVGHPTKPSESWVKQLRGGRTDEPNQEWLRAAAEELGVDPNRWLAMSSQLGASVITSPPRLDPYAILERHARAMETQARAYHELALSIDNAAKGVLEKVAKFDESMTELLEMANELASSREPATDEDGSPVSGAQVP